MSGSSGSKRAAKAAGRAPAAAAAGSLYERYKDALRRGHVAALRGRNDAAVEAYREAATIAPDRALPHASIGGILAKMTQLDEAVASYERALALAPRDETALRGLADVHARTGRPADAADALDRLAVALDAGGRLTDATDAARRAMELDASAERRERVEALLSRLRSAPDADEAARRSLEGALKVLEPGEPPALTAEGEPETAAAEVNPPAAESEPVAAETGKSEERGVDAAAEPAESENGPEAEPAAAAGPAPDAEPEPIAEPAGLGIALGAMAENALHHGDPSARDHLLAAARAHRRAGRTSAALDACALALGIAPSDADVHLMLAELYLDRGWRVLAIDKLLLLGRLADLDADSATRDRLCAIVGEQLPDEPRLADLCA